MWNEGEMVGGFECISGIFFGKVLDFLLLVSSW